MKVATAIVLGAALLSAVGCGGGGGDGTGEDGTAAAGGGGAAACRVDPGAEEARREELENGEITAAEAREQLEEETGGCAATRGELQLQAQVCDADVDQLVEEGKLPKDSARQYEELQDRDC